MMGPKSRYPRQVVVQFDIFDVGQVCNLPVGKLSSQVANLPHLKLNYYRMANALDSGSAKVYTDVGWFLRD